MVPGINFSKKEYSSTFQTKSQQSISSNAVPTAPHLPTLALAKPKPPKAKLPGFPEAIPSLHPEIVSVPHPPTYIAHPVNPEVNDNI